MRKLLMIVVVAIAAKCPAPDFQQDIQIHESRYIQQGIASWYGPDFDGKVMSNGQIFNQFAFTCAHRFLPLGKWIKVRTQDGNQVTVQVTDRGPFYNNRILDLSYAAAAKLGILDKGLERVTIFSAEN